jgi:DNA-binding transcriptional ArsR family regulator
MYDEGKEARELRARSHPARVAILALLAKDGRELTIAVIRTELPRGMTLRDAYYHLRILKASHLVAEDSDHYRLL